jgi:hypothetical protein
MIYGMVIAPVPPPAIKDGFARDASPDRSGLTRERACCFEWKVTFRARLSGEANGSHFMVDAASTGGPAEAGHYNRALDAE